MLAGRDFAGFNSASVEAHWGPLHRASAYGSGADIDFLLRAGASLDLVDCNSWTSLFVAVGYNNVDTFKRLMLKFKPEYISHKDLRGWSLLHLAAEEGNPEIICSLVQHGFEPWPPVNECSLSDFEQEQLTPAAVARSAGQGVFQNFILGLELGGIQVISDSEDIFWPLDEI